MQSELVAGHGPPLDAVSPESRRHVIVAQSGRVEPIFECRTRAVMRHVLVDYARDRLRQKRGGGAVHIPIDAAVVLSSQQVEQVVAVDVALQRLANTDERKSRVFEMRFFGGLTVEEVAEALGVSSNTVIRDWNFARAWLRRELGGPKGSDSGPLARH